jgi:hypothetical protein
MAMSRNVLAIVTDTLRGEEPIEEIRGRGGGNGLAVRVVVPAVEPNVLHHALGDVDGPKREAAERLEAALTQLRARGVEAIGGVGDPDPIRAAQDALLESPADEVLIFEHGEAQSRWYEDGLFERAQEAIEPPLRMIVLESDAEDGPEHVVDVEEAGVGTVAVGADKEVGSAYLPGLSRLDFTGMVCGVVGTIVAVILAAAVTASSASEGWEAVAILIAIGIALVNMAHVVGLTLMESVRYRGGFAIFFRTLSLVGTPLAVLINLLILIFA